MSQPLRTFAERITYEVPLEEQLFGRTYVLATTRAGSIFSQHSQALRDQSAWRFEEVATGHDVMITEPGCLSHLLVELVSEWEPV